MLLRETHCKTWGTNAGDGLSTCTECEPDYILTSNGDCYLCAGTSVCDLSACTHGEKFFTSTSIGASCLLNEECLVLLFPEAGCDTQFGDQDNPDAPNVQDYFPTDSNQSENTS